MASSNSKKKLVTDAPVVIYKASAGSGKTFTLTLYYLWLLFSKENTSDLLYSERNKTYRHILAVTFTNKATGEMKARIIKSLYNLAMGVDDSNTKIYAEELIASKCVKDYQELQERSKEILYTLLHDYTGFNVSTIDTFFQRTMRAFVRDIGAQGGYNVELDSDSLAKEAIDRMYLSLSDGDKDDALWEWLLVYDMYQIEKGSKWNSAETEIRRLAKELFKEDYKEWNGNSKGAHLPTKGEIEAFNKAMTQEMAEFEEEWRGIISEGCAILQGVEDDEMTGKKTSYLKYFTKKYKSYTSPSKTLLDSDREKWPHRTNKVSAYAHERFDKLVPCFERLKELIEAKEKIYYTYETLKKNLFSFGILSDVDSHLRDIIKERNLMLLSDTTNLLSGIINNTETPFIYEKTGVNIHHYMIDEFQDTSNSQWQNFKPLLKESISKGGHNLIVGDVKQSIYRWRNSDWSMLNGLPNSEESFVKNGAISLSMDVNWRSAPNVVAFNNKFFTYAIENLRSRDEKNPILMEKLTAAYRDNEQKFNSKKAENTGYVKVSFESNGDEYNERILKKLYADIQGMLENNYSAGKIAILVRWNKEASMIAQYLMSEQKDGDKKFYVISNEALKIKNSKAVKSILAIMRYINSPENDVCKLMMNYELVSSSFAQPDTVLEETISRMRENSIDDIQERLDVLSTKSLYEMCEGIAEMINTRNDVDQIPYLQAFQDQILSYMAQNGSALSEFLDWWDSHSEKLYISTPETNNAIRIITIHKSKGLEFPTVFIPFCDWSLGDGLNIMWGAPMAEGKEMWRFPLPITKGLLKSIYAENYTEEKAMALIDNLNIAYVAFTRAEDNLIIYAKKGETDTLKKQTSINSFMYKTLLMMFKDKENRASFDEDVYELGTMYLPQQSDEEVSCVAEISEYDVAPIESKLRLKLKGESYFDEHSRLSIGKIKHEMMSEIVIADDIERIAKKYEKLGVITTEESEDFVREVASQINANPQIAEWFAVGKKVLNESSVLNYTGDGKISYRPDRVVIDGDKVTVVDYKFGAESPAYIKQVESYISLLKKMGYFNVNGYVWYVSLGKVI
ncbi:MAG: UvrD-helicase domain-containing protein [Muribaculaceae bacterium]|nr:UvrD-helicase domain-containing protein [Muribaculaceae bacterium]